MAVMSASDSELLREARAGDHAALTELYVRHRAAALRVARSYRSPAEAEDLVSAAFERVMGALRRGGGPVEAFRAYLYVTLRRLAMQQAAQADNEPLDQVPETVVAVAGLPPIDASERALVSEAFAGLPERWQVVLWQIAVEGRHPREVATATGMQANTVSVLAHRARERLRQTYLQAHVRTHPARGCDPHRSRLGAYVRGGLSRRHRGAADDHLAGCEPCRELVAELADVNRLLVRAVAPLFAVGSGDLVVPTAGAASAGLATASTSLTGPVAGLGAGAAGAGVAAKVTAGLAAAVAALVVTVVPHDRGSTDQGAADVAIGDRAPGDAEARGGDGDALGANAPAPTPQAGLPPSTGATDAPPATGPTADVRANIGLPGAPGDGGPVAGQPLDLGVDATASPGLALDLGASWTAGLLGTGALDVSAQNLGADPVAGLSVDVELSPGARATTASLPWRCAPADPSEPEAALGFLHALTCELGTAPAHGASTFELPVHVAGADETATLVLRTGATVVDTLVVHLTPPA
jgi:RNA polymerase sigma factor (sigma-70 family)